ncbi:MAG TPA: hypothetical protein VHL58_06255 [Thermoanaerobaculia bacterium]|nr:hypothetical protein [Thermoanaerobaculia bacterium]
MRLRTFTLPEIGFVVATRGILGFGVGLLLSEYLSPRRRRGLAWTAAAIGVLTTIPAAMIVLDDERIVEVIEN